MKRFGIRTGIEKGSGTSFRTGIRTGTGTKKILAYCHSQTHEQKDSKIINTLKINENDEIDTCDLYGEHSDDIKIDLSKELLTEINKKTI